jgi:hypothetical protein
MTGLPLADIRGPGLLTVAELAAYREFAEQAAAEQRLAAARGRRPRR